MDSSFSQWIVPMEIEILREFQWSPFSLHFFSIKSRRLNRLQVQAALAAREISTYLRVNVDYADSFLRSYIYIYYTYVLYIHTQYVSGKLQTSPCFFLSSQAHPWLSPTAGFAQLPIAIVELNLVPDHRSRLNRSKMNI